MTSHNNPSTVPQHSAPGLPAIDVRDQGGKRDGVPQTSEKRLFVQLLAFRVPHGGVFIDSCRALIGALEKIGMCVVLYDDVNDPMGFGVLALTENPDEFVTRLRPVFHGDPLNRLEFKANYTMMGRTYSIGHEPDLEWWLLRRTRETLMNDSARWGIWYPLRRKGTFNRIDPHEQGIILKEHAQIGMAYGHADLAHDVRLASFGMDANDNDFTIGLVGRELHPLTHVVQAMRKTVQTSEYIEKMGPFFVGRAMWKTPGTHHR